MVEIVTPPRQAQEVARTLSRSEVVLIPGFGHGSLPLSDCANTIMLDFLDRPDDFDTSCVKSIRMPTFATE